MSSKFRERANRVFYSVETPWIPRMLVLAFTIGIVGGLAAVGFHYLILLIKRIFWGATSTATFLDTVRALPWYYRLLAPALGGAIVGPLVTYIVKEARGHGVPEVMEAVALRDGKIRFLVAPLKAMVSAICIGSGGSAGREGPIVQIGASFGSSLGQFFRLTPDRIKTLLGAGAAAGIAGTFNAPMAGVIFSIEVILREVKLDSFSPIVIAAVTGTAIANSLFGRTGPIFDIPVHQLVGYWELLFYAGLGLFAAFVGLVYSNLLYAFEDLFEHIPFPEAGKAALGGLLLGGLALVVPQIHATGYPVMESALHGRLPAQLVFVLMGAKILATSLTLGSGGSGGIFAPSLFIGAMTGSTYGTVVGAIFPGFVAMPSAYAMVGMGAVFAAATHAPLSSIVIIFEMTRDPKIILPLMFACIISSVTASQYQKKNIYTTKLLRRGVDIENVKETSLMESMQVREIMIREPITIHGHATITEARDMFKRTFLSYLPVIDEETGEFLGMLRYHTAFGYRDGDYDEDMQVQRLVQLPPVIIHEDDHLLKALKAIDMVDTQVLPVFAVEDSEHIIGVISRGDIIRAYNQRLSQGYPEGDADFEFSYITELRELIEAAQQPIQAAAENSGVRLEIKMPDSLPPVNIDGSKLSWILTNLLGNAIRYTPKGKAVELAAWKGDGGVYIMVKDHGPGLSPEKRERIFRRDASGYALAMSKSIIEATGGSMWVESSVGYGATFSIWLKTQPKEPAN